MIEQKLSVSEIDDLMAIFKGGRRAVDRLSDVENFDPNQPAKIPKGIFEALTIRHEQAARTIAQGLRTQVRKDLAVALASLEQGVFSGFRDGLEEPCCVFVVEMAPLRHPAYLVLDHALAFACLDRLLGGTGGTDGEGRDLTPTEVAVLGEIIHTVNQAHVGVWQRYLNLQPRILRTVTVPRFLHDMRGTDPLLLARYRFTGFAEGTTLTFAMPLAGVDSHLQYNRRESPEPSPEKRGQARGRVLQHLGGVSVNVSVSIGEAQLPVREILGLERGDVVVLDRKISERLDLVVEGRPKFAGFLHRRAGRLVFRVDRATGDPPAP